MTYILNKVLFYFLFMFYLLNISKLTFPVLFMRLYFEHFIININNCSVLNSLIAHVYAF